MNNLDMEIKKLVEWVKDYVEKSGAKGVVIGNSGGKDSATVTAIAVKALGKDRVLNVMMPCSTISQDKEDAKLLSSTFGVQLLDVDLNNSYSVLEDNINSELSKFDLQNPISKEASINMKPRLRMLTLYSIAQTLNYLVMGTGNLCEATVGYTTKWGDSVSDFNPIGNFTAEEVLQIGKALGVPNKIISKAPADGLGSLTDEEKLGVTYKDISEYILTGSTDGESMKIIDNLYKKSIHKRSMIPVYELEGRVNFVEKLNNEN